MTTTPRTERPIIRKSRTAIDRDTGKVLTPEQAEMAASNPGIWTWVDWIDN